MSNEEFKKKQDEQRAAHMLMVEFVKSNADLMATVLEPIVAMWGEVTYPSLKDNMGVVSQVFAGVALELIDHNSNLEPEDADNMVLPVGAKTMSSTIEELSKFIASVRYLFVLFIDKKHRPPCHRHGAQGILQVRSANVRLWKRFGKTLPDMKANTRSAISEGCAQ